MKAIRILGKNIIESFNGVFRNLSLSMASISCITITLILVGFSILLSFNVNNFTKEIEKDLNIVVFLDRDTKPEECDEINNIIKKISNVNEIVFNSKNDVKESMQKESKVFDSVLSQYTPETNPLQDTFLVKV